MKLLSFLFMIGALLSGCHNLSVVNDQGENPAAEGFNLAESDAQAMDIADKVMQAMGGRKAWDATRVLKWNFFGRRVLTWDKYSQRCKVEIPSDSLVIVIDLLNDMGNVKKGEDLLTDPDSLGKYLQMAREIWINDSYWLVMPFKLKDSGVTLKYVGQDTAIGGAMSDILSLTFNEVGVTPDNKYHVYVDRLTSLVTQWDFYGSYDDPEPRFSLPWWDYQRYGGILLSGDRQRAKLSDIEVDPFLADGYWELR